MSGAVMVVIPRVGSRKWKSLESFYFQVIRHLTFPFASKCSVGAWSMTRCRTAHSLLNQSLLNKLLFTNLVPLYLTPVSHSLTGSSNAVATTSPFCSSFSTDAKLNWSVEPKPFAKNMEEATDDSPKFVYAGMPASAFRALEEMYQDATGDTLKQYESENDPAVPADSAFIIRLDGVSFSNFTSGLNKPFDERFQLSMVETAKDLLAKFNPTLAYTVSDEISLTFPPANPPPVDPSQPFNTLKNFPPSDDTKTIVRTHTYSGRMQKLVSTVAGYASARLNYHLSTHDYLDLPTKVSEKMRSHTAFMDARVVQLPTPDLMARCIFWRSNFDGLRNAITNIAHAKFGSKPLHKQSVRAKLDMLHAKGVDVFRDIPPKFLYGVWCKKEQYETQGIDPRTGNVVPTPVIRGRIRVGSFNWADWTEEERVQFLLAKYWNDGDRSPPKDPLP